MERPEPSQSPLVSVVVPTRNSSKTLGQCLASIRAQTFKAVEILVIDNFSRDDTVSIARKFGATPFQKGPERSAQVNYGVSLARGKYVYRPDSDVLLEPDLIRQCVDTCLTQNLDGILIRTTPDQKISIWARLHSLERGNFYDESKSVAVTFFLKSAFEAIGGYDEMLIAGEDYDLHNRFVAHGYKYGRITAGETHLGEETSLAEVARKHYYYGKTIFLYVRKNPGRAVDQMSPLRLFRLVKKKRKELVWWVPILLPVYEFVRYSSTALGIVSTARASRRRDNGTSEARPDHLQARSH
jgi:glycosyltransferase involved in cell wall biosynthesis